MPDRPWQKDIQIAALRSTIRGIALWSETATCVGARFDTEDRIELVAPYGVPDRLALRWRADEACSDPSALARLSLRKG